MPENKQEATNAQPSSPKKAVIAKPVTDKEATKKGGRRAVKKTPEAATPTQVSRVAVLALLLALLAGSGVGGIYYWHIQEQNKLEQRIIAQNLNTLAASEEKIQKMLAQQNTANNEKMAQLARQIQEESQARIGHLEQTIARLEQNQPADWLIHEAEYLVRIAARTIWLEQDTKAAIALLQDADLRLTELQDPRFLPVRQLIHQDIESLQLMPALKTEEVILALMGMNSQVNALPLAMVYIPDSQEAPADFELSESTADWKENLQKTWRKFLADFITVSRRTANVEPLMSPQYQQNLRQNLQLKLQLAQWAASEQNAQLYSRTLDEIELWIKEYFDTDNVKNQNFIQGIASLKSELISFDYSNELTSLPAIRKIVSQGKPAIANNTKAEAAQEKAGAPDRQDEAPATQAVQEESQDEGSL